MEKKKGILVAILGILSLVLVTVGVTFAFFNYVKLGTTENSITAGTIEFLYTEVNKVGAGIKLENALPISDTAGKMQTGSGKVFNFKVTGKTIGNMDVPYEITARMKKDSDLDPSVVKIYLTEIVGSTEKEILLEKYDSLTQTTRVTEDIATEKTLYKGLVPTGSTNYEKEFNLRMWVDEKTDYSPVEDEEGNIEYPYNNKTFTLTVNVYADAKVVTEEEIDMANTTNIETVVVNNSEITKSDSTEYDYYTELAIEEKEASIEVETTNKDATVEVTKLDDTTAYTKTSVKRLSTTQTITLQLDEGDNLFNIKIVSANKQVEDEYTLKITTKDKTNPSVSGSLEGKVLNITYSDNVGVVGYIVSTRETTPTSGWTEIETGKEGTLSYTLPNIGTYYIYVKDKEGNITKSEESFTPASNLFCAYSAGKTWTYDYSGSSKTFTVPCNGTYKLEVWGAQGGNTQVSTGGKGGYSYGNKILTKDNNLYIAVGGQGLAAIPNNGTGNKGLTGGYNGGAYGFDANITSSTGTYGGSGGGATHIALGTTNRGELKNYASYKSEILIVAGGGGGGAGYYGWPAPDYNFTHTGYNGGAGGGTTGGTGAGSSSQYGTGGSQSSGGTSSYGGNGSFGTSTSSANHNAGGGGGYYGGASSSGSGGAGGGSGYIGGVTGGSTSSGQRTGNGYARITLVSLN